MKWDIKSPKDIEEPYTRITKWKKPVWEGYIWYGSNYMTFWKKKNCGDKKSVVAAGPGLGLMNRQNRGFSEQ